jgi:hypothetical protein
MAGVPSNTQASVQTRASPCRCRGAPDDTERHTSSRRDQIVVDIVVGHRLRWWRPSWSETRGSTAWQQRRQSRKAGLTSVAPQGRQARRLPCATIPVVDRGVGSTPTAGQTATIQRKGRGSIHGRKRGRKGKGRSLSTKCTAKKRAKPIRETEVTGWWQTCITLPFVQEHEAKRARNEEASSGGEAQAQRQTLKRDTTPTERRRRVWTAGARCPLASLASAVLRR